MRERPDCLDDEHLQYLDDLRESGVTNMRGAGAYLENEFPLDKTEASDILCYWMDTFSDRHKVSPKDA